MSVITAGRPPHRQLLVVLARLCNDVIRPIRRVFLRVVACVLGLIGGLLLDRDQSGE